MAEVTDYTEMVRIRLGSILLEGTRNDPAFEQKIVDLMAGFGLNYEKFNTGIANAVALGVSPDVALEMFITIVPLIKQ